MPVRLEGIFFDAGNTLIVEEPGKHLWEMETRMIRGALEVLAELKRRYRIGVISNTVGSGDADVAEVLEKVGLGRYVDALVTSRDFGRAKPDPAIYREGARRLGVRLERTCMVGDRLETDIAGALNAGIDGVWLQHPGSTMVDGIVPTHVIAELIELPPWIEARQASRS